MINKLISIVSNKLPDNISLLDLCFQHLFIPVKLCFYSFEELLFIIKFTI